MGFLLSQTGIEAHSVGQGVNSGRARDHRHRWAASTSWWGRPRGGGRPVPSPAARPSLPVLGGELMCCGETLVSRWQTWGAGGEGAGLASGAPHPAQAYGCPCRRGCPRAGPGRARALSPGTPRPSLRGPRPAEPSSRRRTQGTARLSPACLSTSLWPQSPGAEQDQDREQEETGVEMRWD